jgi:peptidoglycan L-alanyl-D-glutamate endopeptidase CwlK|tara:strand:- start:5306 stop:5725 length:420 start_codon:yes stop_codon:yes gene_type:complete
MPKFGKVSISKLLTCDVRLQALAEEVVGYHDCSCIEGWRNKETQNKYFDEGRSKVRWPNGKHNNTTAEGLPCSLAIDLVPYPNLDWNDRERFYYFAGVVLGIARGLSIPIRWGGDWDMDHNFKDQKFDDLVHFEIKGKK